jgi:peptidoglycan hydrolase CwlO-like protein
MKKTLILVIFVFVGAAIIFYRSGVKKDLAYKQQIEELNTKIKSKEDSIHFYEGQIDIFADKIQRTEMKLEENQTKIKKIYKEYEVHLLSIDSYDIDELERFFSDRYKDSTNIQ